MLRNFYYICTSREDHSGRRKIEAEQREREREIERMLAWQRESVRATILIWCHSICISYLHVECVAGQDKQDELGERRTSRINMQGALGITAARAQAQRNQ